MLLPRDLVRHPPTFCLLLSISLLFFGVQKNMRNMKFPQPQFGSLPNCVPNSELFYRTQHTPHILPGCPPPPYQCPATPDYLEKLVKMIKEGSVDPNEDPHIDGVTGMHVVTEEGHLECVNLLIAAGANVTVLDDEECTPLLLAIKGNYGEVA